MARSAEPLPVATVSAAIHLLTAIVRCREALSDLERRAGQLSPEAAAQAMLQIKTLASWLRVPGQQGCLFKPPKGVTH
jgi:hypothetical protein